MKFFYLLLFFPIIAVSQTSGSTLEKYPVFDNCTNTNIENQEECFKTELTNFITANFKLPESLEEIGYKGQPIVLFEVKETGSFEIIYIDAFNVELKEEIKRVFALLPVVEPPTYNGNPIHMQFRIPISIGSKGNSSDADQPMEKVKNMGELEYDNIVTQNSVDRKYQSSLNIPFSHQNYSRFYDELNQLGTNSHTASKPFLYKNVESYYDFDTEISKLKKNSNSWFGRKLWNEHLFEVQAEDYWFTADFAVDLQMGKDLKSELKYTYNNTRAAILQGGLGENLNFYAAVYESQGRFADYFNYYAESLKPDGGNPAIIPGMGVAKEFGETAYDYPVAEGYISYSPGNFFNIQFGHGKNFIGDGYRSLFLSDNASLYPYLKLNTTFWKIKYTNIWMSLRDVRPEVTADGSFLTKYVATHYLSLNVTKRLNIGLFESVIWQNDNNRGFDLNYLNPVIFYRAIEFSTGSRGGNALLGISGKYKFSNSINLYSQLMIDEFSSFNIFSGNGSYKNKIGFQLGAKYYNAFNVQNLHLQAEFNQVRPFVYSHNSVVLNYGHNNQSLAHLWGANFREMIGIARYSTGRWYGEGKMVVGKRGLNFSDPEMPNYGGDIYVSEDDREQDNNHSISQGNTANSLFAQLELGYLINPSTNLKLYGSVIYRNFDPIEAVNPIEQPTVWFNFGLRTDVFNWYFDY